VGLKEFFNKKATASNETEIMENEKFSDPYEGNKAVLENLKSEGDDAKIVRPVLHYCYFKRKKDLKKFIEVLETTGVQYKPSNIDLGVVVITASSMIKKEILSEIESMSNAVKMCDGDYDGWETEIMRNLTLTVQNYCTLFDSKI